MALLIAVPAFGDYSNFGMNTSVAGLCPTDSDRAIHPHSTTERSETRSSLSVQWRSFCIAEWMQELLLAILGSSEALNSFAYIAFWITGSPVIIFANQTTRVCQVIDSHCKDLLTRDFSWTETVHYLNPGLPQDKLKAGFNHKLIESWTSCCCTDPCRAQGTLCNWRDLISR
ncbi:hypothetical protein R1sor_007107 [Riccia sorocarpa]|uniref:Uncharacterized protein n=1 Tax=Riccia sorocarpa TaxID=122646 RepID=A0ABD3HRR0_9MARC